MQMAGYPMPSAEAARKFSVPLSRGGVDRTGATGTGGGPGELYPEESAPLGSFAQVNQEVVRELGRRCAQQKLATVDLDATIIESWKKRASRTYEGVTSFQRVLPLWAEMDVVLADVPGRQRAGAAAAAVREAAGLRRHAENRRRVLLSWRLGLRGGGAVELVAERAAAGQAARVRRLFGERGRTRRCAEILATPDERSSC
jgi:hypothetical protein